MDINYLAVLVCGILSMILGSVWYGPMFGKKWIEIIGATDEDLERRKEMQKNARPLYFVSFVLSIFQAAVLAYYINALGTLSGVVNALLIWAAFVMPTVAAGSMWNNDSARISWMRFLIQASYYLVLFIVFALVLVAWK